MPTTVGPKTAKTDRRQHKGKEVDSEESSGADRGGRVSGTAAGAEQEICADCSKRVLKTQTGMVCDGCGYWHHAACEKVEEDIYVFLQDHNGDPSLLWYCKRCVVTCKKLTSLMLMMHEQQQSLEERVKDLAQTMQQKLDDAVKEINSKLERKDEEIKKAGDENQKRVEDLPNCVIDVVTSRLQGDREEEEEIRKRRNNVIIHGIKESTQESFEGRNKDDEDQIVNILHEMGCDTVSVNNAFRIGKKEAQTDKPRALLVALASEDQKDRVLQMAKNLRTKVVSGLSKVFVHQDLTRKQRMRRQVLVQELKSRQEGGEKDLVLINGRIVTRRARVERDVV
jgi:hypothetical protein